MGIPKGTRPWRKSWRRRWRPDSTYRQLTLLQREVLRYVEDNADDTGSVLVTTDQLAEYVSSPRERFGRSTVNDAVRRLAGFGVIETGRMTGQETGRMIQRLTRLKFKEFQTEEDETGRQTGRMTGPSSRRRQKKAEKTLPEAPGGAPDLNTRHVVRAVMSMLRTAGYQNWKAGPIDLSAIKRALKADSAATIAAKIYLATVRQNVPNAALALANRFRLTAEASEVSHYAEVASAFFASDLRNRSGPGNGGNAGSESEKQDTLRLPLSRPNPTTETGPIRDPGREGRDVQDDSSMELGTKLALERVKGLLDRVGTAPRGNGGASNLSTGARLDGKDPGGEFDV